MKSSLYVLAVLAAITVASGVPTKTSIRSGGVAIFNASATIPQPMMQSRVTGARTRKHAQLRTRARAHAR